jgi:manganese/zinc/iron transport system substrate-binding protein
MKRILYLLAIAFAVGCAPSSNKDEKPADKTPEKINIVVTTNILGDMVSNIVKSKANVTTLMGAGVDPHLYKATQNDISALMNADIIVYNGLHLEGKMGEIFEGMTGKQLVIAASDGIPDSLLITSNDFKGAYDPHIWFDPTLWSMACLYVTEKIAENAPSIADDVRLTGRSYANNMLGIDFWIKQELKRLPENKRLLITAHDAFGYFGRAYGVKVKGLQGLSTLSEYGLKDVTEMVDFIITNSVESIFVETSVNQQSVEAVVEGCKQKGYAVQIGNQLYSDAMGDPNSNGGTYLKMIKHNVLSIIRGLK